MQDKAYAATNMAYSSDSQQAEPDTSLETPFLWQYTGFFIAAFANELDQPSFA